MQLICSDDYGDCPRPLPEIGELKDAVDLTERKGVPSWDYDVSGVFLPPLNIFPFLLIN